MQADNNKYEDEAACATFHQRLRKNECISGFQEASIRIGMSVSISLLFHHCFIFSSVPSISFHFDIDGWQMMQIAVSTCDRTCIRASSNNVLYCRGYLEDISVFLLKNSPDMASESDGFAWNGIWDLSINSWEMCAIRSGNRNDSDRKCWNMLVICYSCFSQISSCSIQTFKTNTISKTKASALI